MYKSCSRCGKIHDANYRCNVNRIYRGGIERKLRNSYAWEQKSIEIRERANYLCEYCKLQGAYNYNEIEVHHITKLAEDPDGLLDDRNLVCLCVKHHRQADRGEIDSDLLRNLAMVREGK